MELPAASPLHPHLDQIEESTLRAAELCKQMLAYAGKGRLLVQPVDLSAVVKDTLQLLRGSLHKNTTLRENLAPHPPSVLADATQMGQIIMSLVMNASEAIPPEGGKIEIHTGWQRADRACLDNAVMGGETPEGDYAFIEVSDTGVGMAAETLAKIFDPFFTTKFTGRGLGLAAVLGIVRSHKGAVKVASQPNKGTTFRILLPCADGADARPAEAPPPPERWRGQGLALVVDDEAAIRATLGLMLKSLGFDVRTAGHGREGMALLREHPGKVAIVLLDLTMPEMDGVETFHELRLIDPTVHILLMSGYSEQDAVQRFVGKNLAGFLPKPFHLKNLTAKLKQILS